MHEYILKRPNMMTHVRLCVCAAAAAAATVHHPLDPLSPAELTAAADVCRQWAEQQGVQELRFNFITLKEPSKAALLAFESGAGPCPPREAFAILQVSSKRSC